MKAQQGKSSSSFKKQLDDGIKSLNQKEKSLLEEEKKIIESKKNYFPRGV